jgi:beta-galactosidase
MNIQDIGFADTKEWSETLKPIRASSIYRTGCILILSAILFGWSIVSGVAVPRQDQMLADGWKFNKDDAGITAATDSWQSVTIPHTWNTKSADEGDHKGDPHFKSGYYRGACWYAKSLDIPADWQGKRVFIRFEAASLVSKAYLNGQLLGEHRGGFTAFCYELTPLLHFGATNDLRVQVDNSPQKDVPPLSGDFNVDGGIYRPVHLIVTDPLCISPLDLASPGVYLTTKSLTNAAAQIEVRTMVSNGGTGPAQFQVKTDIADAGGKIVATQMQSASVDAGQTQPILSTLNLAAPHLWNGRKDPYLYTATVSLVRGADTADSINQPLGVRTVEISEDKGFLLNGQPYPIHGVNRHQDWGDQGWAATPANFDEDAQIMLDMGVTAIRLAHYPQSDYLHNLCDHNGILLWNEIPLVNSVNNTPEFNANAEQQLREMILQRYNHPSVAFWGLCNEIGIKKGSDGPVDLIGHLKSVAQELDPSRLIVCAIHIDNPVFDMVVDHPCFNCYPGWYAGIDTLQKQITEGATEIGKRAGISEYGAGSNTTQHQEGALTQRRATALHSEEWQTHVHELVWPVIRDNPQLWGSFVWCMFDFPSARRHEGGFVGINDKGLVTEDRSTKKDAYFFYQANWTDKPMVHIASSRMTPRREAVTQVEVFSNCEKVELSVNGTPLDPVTPDNVRVFRWPSLKLQSGKNEIKAIAASSQGEISDSCEWVVDPSAAAPDSGPQTPAPEPAQ